MTHNLYVLKTQQDEIDNFKSQVKPSYSDTLMAIWSVMCAPVLNFINSFSKRNTQAFVKRMEG